MKKNGFSIVEMLIAIIIVALLIVLMLPAYVSITESVKRNTYNNKVKQLESETLKYVNKYKDDIKNESCRDYNISDLITSGIMESDSKGKNVLINPVDNSEFSGVVKVCYCPSVFDIKAYYVETYNSNKKYHRDDKVVDNNKIYICIKDYPDNYLEHLDTYKLSNTEYFKEAEC